MSQRERVEPVGRRRPLRLEEIEGFLVGIAFDLEQARRAGSPDSAGERRLARARRFLHAGKLGEAETELEHADEARKARRVEVELTEVPRDLVDYVPRGDRGAAPSREGDALSNRLVLVARLLQLRGSQGYSVDRLIPKLNEAEGAYRRGDRSTARRLMDRVHSEIEELSVKSTDRAEEDAA